MSGFQPPPGVRPDHPAPWPQPPASGPVWRQHKAAAGFAIGGLVAAIVVKLVAPALPVISGHSLNEITPYCTGALGAFVRGLGGAQTAAACNDIGIANLVINLVALACLAVAAAAGFALYRHRNGARQ